MYVDERTRAVFFADGQLYTEMGEGNILGDLFQGAIPIGVKIYAIG